MSTFRPVTPKSPVPSDIEVAESVAPLPIQKIAQEAGILDSELELYGPNKAKVRLQVCEFHMYSSRSASVYWTD